MIAMPSAGMLLPAVPRSGREDGVKRILLIVLLALATACGSSTPERGLVLDTWHEPGHGGWPDTWRLKVSGDENGDLRGKAGYRDVDEHAYDNCLPGDQYPQCTAGAMKASRARQVLDLANDGSR